MRCRLAATQKPLGKDIFNNSRSSGAENLKDEEYTQTE